ncbi:DUF362 domain-containing protein [Natranaerofaba carboxydovora]|uniref:DUF362 domain-containing protein n=1 Tax=Natranaerofaba carboxydovora TaxID=2742683 RepID=UPI001F12F004|nr:DUF362 domain-containing protein [Natranaerofaba carboxydovora]UMZ72732.1 NADH-quinone oxidoreductase subunit I [Natranaerofaba carboxydovora]
MKVSITKCKSYEERLVDEALDELMNYIGGFESYIQPGMKVLLKVNLLSAKPPEKAVTTHPVIVKVLCQKIKELGATPWVGDSSGGILPNQNPTTKALQVSEIEQAVLSARGEVLNFDKCGAVKVDNPGNKTFPEVYIAKPIFDADLVISVPKFKTHGLTLFTGSVKNMFGCVPGSLKRDYHRKAPRLNDFARILADIYNLTLPSLTIMDGILGMEGDGPSGGNPKDIGLLLASSDGASLDEVAAKIAGLSSGTLPTGKACASMGYGVIDLSEIELPGKIEDWRLKDFQPPQNPMVIANFLPGFLVSGMLNQLKTLPDVSYDECVGCNICRDSCPVEAIDISRSKANINWNSCIECLCCHELCPEKAIRLTPKGVLSKLAFGLANFRRKN